MKTWNKEKALAHLRDHAHTASLGLCARYTREAIEAGGLTLVPRQESAKNYGTTLLLAGFRWPRNSFIQSGDVVVISGFKGQSHGHMAMFDGKKWISDFAQRSLYP